MSVRDPSNGHGPPPAPPAELPELGELPQLVRRLEELARDPARLAGLDEATLNRLRDAAGRVAFPNRTERRALQSERRRRERERKRRHDDAALDATSNRARKRALRFPLAPAELAIAPQARRLLEKQAAAPELSVETGARALLAEPRSCYTCKSDYRELHHHYDSLCPECAELNWQKRTQTADLSGRVAVVTGARVKIGYEAALMLLRAGASVVATTRFPCDSARRFAAEADFGAWGERLQIYGLDLRHTPSVEAFAAHLLDRLVRLDFLIHNACQTVRRPPAYYAHLVEREVVAELDQRARALLAGYEALLASLGAEHDDVAGSAGAHDSARTPVTRVHNLPARVCRGLSSAASLTQLDLLGEEDQAHLFPAGILDGEGQQLDLRAGNTWRMELADVPTVELVEVQLVNAVAPFVLSARLKPLMLRVASADKHIVNVSAMEGQFYRTLKTTRHPHTNMAKAALNMLTRTSAADYVRDGIHMNSVDTGWVTDEDPFERAVNKESEQRFAPPLDAVDGAARVLDPIFTGFNTGRHCWGQFLKDYQPARW